MFGMISVKIKSLNRKKEINLKDRPIALVTGAGRGVGLGFPTANVQPVQELFPASGVYVCHVWIGDERQGRLAVTNIGTNPTFDGKTLGMEVHLMEKPGELVGKTLTVSFLERLRGEKRFSGPD